MMSDESCSRDSSHDEKLDGIVDEILERQRQGQKPSIEEFVGYYPELEQELRDLFPAINMAERLRSSQHSTFEPFETESTSFEVLNRDSQRFQILRPLDRGGLGVVSVALDQELHREVALKEIREDRADDRGLRSKFILEAVVTGGLEHPGIVPVYALGASADGRPYYAMRLIRGSNLRDHIRQFHQEVKAKAIVFDGPQLRQLVRRFLVVCEAIDYAHSRGVLHRDLKPSNVMLGRYGETLVVDWGLAKATGMSGPSLESSPNPSSALQSYTDREPPMIPSGSDNATREGSSIGTPGYAPPEQLLGHSENIGVRSDVYGLGAILYELLTNSAPANGSLAQIVQQVTSGSIPSCRSIQPLVPKPIDSICSKAMAVEYNDRYASAGLLRSDVERWLDGSPVTAFQEPALIKLKRWIQKHQTLVSTLLATGTMTLVGTLLFAISVIRSNAVLSNLNQKLDQSNIELLQANSREVEARNRAESRQRAERWERYRSSIATTVSACQADNRSMMNLSLNSAPSEHHNWEWNYFYGLIEDPAIEFSRGSMICPKTLKTARIQETNEVAIGQLFSNLLPKILKFEASVSAVRFSPDAKRLAVRTIDEQISIWDTETFEKLTSAQSGGSTYDLVFRPDTKELLISVPDIFRWKRWRFDSSDEFKIDVQLGDPESSFHPCFNLECDRLLALYFDRARLIDLGSGETLSEWKGVHLQFSPDGKRFLALEGEELQIRDSQHGTVLQTLKGLPKSLDLATVWQSDWSLDGNRVLLGASFPLNFVVSWDLVSDQSILLKGHRNGIWDTEISPDGKTGVSGSQDTTARLWNLETGKPMHILQGHRAPIRSVHFSPDGRRLITSGDDTASRLWDTQTGELISSIATSPGQVDLDFSLDGSVVIANSLRGKAAVWEIKRFEQNGLFRGHSSYVYDAAFSPDGIRAVSAAWDGTVQMWDIATKRIVRKFSDNEPGNYRSVTFSPDGQHIAATKIHRGEGLLIVWQIGSEEPIANWGCAADTEDFRACFDTKSEIVFAGTTDGTIRCFDINSKQMIKSLAGHEKGEINTRYAKTCSDVAVHPDGKRLFSAGYDGAVLVWNIQNGTRIARMAEHNGMIARIVISQDGEWLASAGQDGKVRIWNANSYDSIAVLDHGIKVYSVSISPDKTRLATGCEDGLVRLWDMATHSQVAELHGHSDYVHSVAFSSDGTQIISGSGDQTVRIWDSLSYKKRRQITSKAPPTDSTLE